MSVFEMTDFERKALELAHRHNDKLLVKFCINMINRNKMLTRQNAELLLGVAPPEWGDAAIYKQQRDQIAKIARKGIREQNKLLEKLPMDELFSADRKQAQKRLEKLEDYFASRNMPPVYPQK